MSLTAAPEVEVIRAGFLQQELGLGVKNMDCCFLSPATWTRPGKNGLGALSHGPVHPFSWARNGTCGEKLRGGAVVSRKVWRRYALVCCNAPDGEKGKTAVIVGAGPAGALLALLLARQDWKVEVFERKQWSGGTWAPAEPDGWNVMLGARAAYCLEHVGIKEEVWSEGVLCSGRTAVTGGGLKPKYQPYGYELLAIPQPKLASVLINSGMRNYPGQIAYHFGCALQSLHPEDTVAEFSGSTTPQDTIAVTADLVVGADGLYSRTRAELETKTTGFTSTVHSAPAGRHIRLRVPVDVVGEQVDEKGKTHGPSMLVVARRAKLMWGVPNRDGSMGLTLQGIQGSTAADVSSEMQETFPELSEFFTANGEASARLASAPERMQGTVVATAYNYKQIVLLGDAAHSLLNVTHLGTGLALEDCLVLDRLLQAALQSQDGDTVVMKKCIASALSSFSNERIPEMRAAAQLCSDVSRTNMFQVELQRAILRVVTRVLPRVQPWQKAANTQRVPVQELLKWRGREVLIVRTALLLAMVLLLLRAIRLVRLAFKVVTPLTGFLQRLTPHPTPPTTPP